MDSFEDATIAANGLDFHVVQAGPEDGPLVLLLHGYPEHGRSWARQIAALAGAGFRVWAPDQRGYNLSAKPAGIAAYRLDALAADAVGLIDAAGRARAYVAGHDWGGGVAWWTAIRHPARVARLAVVNMPHPAVLLRRHLYHLHRCWYFYAFLIPRLPEWANARGDYRDLLAAIRASARPGAFDDEQLAAMRAAWSRPGALTAMINWYRAVMWRPPDIRGDVRVHVPTLLVWGARDRFISRAMAAASIAYCDDGRLEVLADATHWVHHEEPERLSELLRSFFATA
jgi:pimeloyl-ACP methyl ester carboxylesterase